MVPPVRSTPQQRDADISLRIVDSIAAENGCDPTDLPVLYETIDPGALDALFRPSGTSQRSIGQVSFRYAGYRVSVDADGTITIE